MPRPVVLSIVALLCAANASAAVKVEKTEYAGWKNCYRVTNGEIELIVTGDVGPRIVPRAHQIAAHPQPNDRFEVGVGDGSDREVVRGRDAHSTFPGLSIPLGSSVRLRVRISS